MTQRQKNTAFIDAYRYDYPDIWAMLSQPRIISAFLDQNIDAVQPKAVDDLPINTTTIPEIFRKHDFLDSSKSFCIQGFNHYEQLIE